MIIFSAPKFFSILKESNTWFADRTFKVVLEYFFRLYTMHAEKDGFVFPCILALLPNKKESTYNTLLRKLLEIKPDLNPKTIMADFEKAAINSFENNVNAVISGCFFHLSQNIWRKIQSEGLTVQYQADGEFQMKLRMLMGLAFVPEQDVSDCFNILMVGFPE